jgi:hypothetical protein
MLSSMYYNRNLYLNILFVFIKFYMFKESKYNKILEPQNKVRAISHLFKLNK